MDGAARDHEVRRSRGSVVLDLADQRRAALRSGSTVGVDVDLQRADAGGQVDDAAQAVVVDAVLHLLRQGVDPHPQAEVERHRPVLDEQVVVAGAAVGDLGSASPLAARQRCRALAGRMPPSRGRAVAGGTRRAGVRSASASASSTGTKRTVSPGRELAELPALGPSATVAGQTKPPRLGPSGPSRIGMSPVKSTAPTAYGGVVDVRRVQARPRRRRGAPTWAWGRPGARRCAPS